MGYEPRSLQRVLAGLEERGLLVRQYRPGQTTLYDFSGFSRAVMAVMAVGGDSPVIPNILGDDRTVRGGVTPVSSKEEDNKSMQSKEEVAAGSVGYCSIHRVQMAKRSKDGATWFSHRLTDGSWCKGDDGDVGHRESTLKQICGLVIAGNCPGRGWPECVDCELLQEVEDD